MTGRVLLDDPHDARVARTATGVLAEFNAAGVLEPADVHVAAPHRAARRRGRRRRAARGGARRPRGTARLGLRRARRGRGTVLGAGDEPVDVSGAAVARARRLGRGCAASPLVAAGADDAGRAPAPARRRAALPGAVLAAGGAGPHRAGRARRPSRRRWTSTGCVPGWPGCSATTATARGPPAARRGRGGATPADGPRRRPGDGQDHHRGEDPRAAPATAPAPRRGSRSPPRPARRRPGCRRPCGRRRRRRPARPPSTLHRLLGWQPGRSRFRHDRDDRLPYDVIVVDETSMVSLTMMARLLDAVRPDARLVLVGDPDQLASVEAGRRPRRPGARPRPSRTAPRRRARGAGAARRDRQRGGHAGPRVAVPRGGRRRSRGPCRPATRTRRSHCCAAEVTTCSSWRRTRPPPRQAVRTDVVDAGVALAAAARRSDVAAALPRWSGTGCCAGTGAAPTA